MSWSALLLSLIHTIRASHPILPSSGGRVSSFPFMHALRTSSPTLRPPDSATLCCPVKMSGPLFQVCSLRGAGPALLLLHPQSWLTSGLAIRARSTVRPRQSCRVCVPASEGQGQLSHSFDFETSFLNLCRCKGAGCRERKASFSHSRQQKSVGASSFCTHTMETV